MPLLTGLSPQMNFWRNTTFRPFHTHPTPLTLLHATSSCSRNWRKQRKVADSITLKRLKPTRQGKWGLLQKATTRGVYKQRTLLRRRQDQPAVKSTLSLTKKSFPELNDQSAYVLTMDGYFADHCPHSRCRFAPAQLLSAKHLHNARGPAMYLIAVPQGSLFVIILTKATDKRNWREMTFLQVRREWKAY